MPTKIIPCDLTVNGLVTATKFIVPKGISNQFLKADGSLDNTVYATKEELDTQAVTKAEYVKEDKKIYFYNNNEDKISTIDATDFILDGMLDSVTLDGNNLVFVFNTDAGKNSITVPLSSMVPEELTEHLKDFNNPHKVTKEQVGLGNADNTSDINKPVSTAQQVAIDKVDSKLMYVETIPTGETADDYTAIQIEKDGASVTVYFRKSDLLDQILNNEEVTSASLNDLKITIDTSTTTEGYLKSYNIKQGTTSIGTIEIPKDKVIEGGSIVSGTWLDTTFTENTTGKDSALKITVINQTDPIYINIDQVTKETINISLYVNQDINIIGKKIYIKKVSDNTILYTLIWAGSTITQDIKTNDSYYVEAESITGYTTPKSDSFTAVSGNSRNVSLKYESEKITIHVSAYDSADMSGQIISAVINGTKTMQTWAGEDIVLFVPFGHSIVIYCDKKNGYSTPFTIERTASAASFAANFVYGETKLQVAIVDVNGDTFSPSEWDTANNANVAGFKLTTSNVDIIIAPDYTNLAWGPNVLIDGCVTETVDYAAIFDFAGKANTDAITATALTYAAARAKNYAWKLANKNGYLPAMGELYEIALNIDAINECRTAVGLSALDKNQYFWDSTQNNATSAWNCNPSSLTVGSVGKSNGCCVLAVCAS